MEKSKFDNPLYKWEDLTLPQIKKIIRAYNQKFKISLVVNKVRKTKEELIAELKKHLWIDNDGLIQILYDAQHLADFKENIDAQKQKGRMKKPKVEKQKVEKPKVEKPKVDMKDVEIKKMKEKINKVIEKISSTKKFKEQDKKFQDFIKTFEKEFQKEVVKEEPKKEEPKKEEPIKEKSGKYDYITSTTENEYEYVQALKDAPFILPDMKKVFNRQLIDKDVSGYIQRVEELYEKQKQQPKPFIVDGKEMIKEVQRAIKDKMIELKSEEKELQKAKNKKGWYKSPQIISTIELNVQQLKDEIEDLEKSIGKKTGSGLGQDKPYALHAVIIKKPYDLNEAKTKAQEFIKDKKKKYYRETKDSFRFRNISKQKFVKGSFRTKKINENISLVFGELKPEYKQLEGSGLFDTLKTYGQRLVNFGKEKLEEFKKKPSMFDGFEPIIEQLIPKYNKGLSRQKGERVYNTFRVPNEKILADMADKSYKTNRNVEGYELLKQTNTLSFYRKGDLIIIVFRGTEVKDPSDLVADLGIALGNLDKSIRFKTDLKDIDEFQKEYPTTKYYYIGVGHSLGGAVLDKFLNLGKIKEGVSYNPAIEKIDYNKPNKNRRIYLSNDPLYKIMGSFSRYHEVRNKDLDIGASHSISNFL